MGCAGPRSTPTADTGSFATAGDTDISQSAPSPRVTVGMKFPDEGHLWQLLGILHHRASDFAGASEALETATLLMPLESATRWALADCQARLGRAELAWQLYRHLAGDDAFCRDLARREPT